MQTWSLVVAAAVVLAGCAASVTDGGQAPIEPSEPEAASPSPPAPARAPAGSTAPPAGGGASQAVPAATDRVQVVWEEGLDITTPLHVVLLGFEASVATALEDAFNAPFGPRQDVVHLPAAYDLHDPASSGPKSQQLRPLPMTQQVKVVVHQAPPEDRQAYKQAAQGREWSAGDAESWVAARLPAWGLADTALPPLVVVHAGTAGHRYVLDLPNGAWDETRIFGGTHRVLVMDISAGPDSNAGTARPYHDSADADGSEAVIEAVEDAIRFRLLQGPVYPVPVAPCHAITIVYAVHTTGDQGILSSIAADEALDEAALLAAFQGLVGEDVFVDVLRLDLPAEDPALWALLRAVGNELRPAGAYIAPHSVQARHLTRAWIEYHWDDYHVDHPGCEEYLSLLVYGDAVDLTVYFGIAEYDHGSGHRYSFSNLPENIRSTYEPGLVSMWPGCCRDKNVKSFDLVDFLLAHETGHLFGLHHPFIALDDGEPLEWAFSTTRTTMSYLLGQMDITYGALDEANWHRNRVAYAAQELAAAGLKEKAVGAGFLTAIEQGDFRGATRIAQGLLY